MIYDEEFTALVREGAADKLRFVSWSEPTADRGDNESSPDPQLETLIAQGETPICARLRKEGAWSS